MDNKEHCTEWENYIIELFKDDNRFYQEITFNRDTGSPILILKVQKAIDQVKRRKGSGPDEIPAELLQLLDKESVAIITSFFNKIYSRGKLPDNWLQSIFITIPKKRNARQCSDYRL
ncbi:uncharacterized protein [Diabrotica undecimpunctata]|uniref:uncharacterized protein n=1 Tax=Diabrotica undecimpunctata TaxID=50387 RepID=UPI003B63D9D2